MKLNDRFRVESDTYNWILIETRQGVNKKGEEVVTENRTYHGNLKQCLLSFVDKELKYCKEVD